MPTATQVIAPRLGVTVTHVRITEWLVEDGATVTEGEPLVAFETDKTTHEVDAPASGTVRQLVAVGDECPVGGVIAEIT